jgi:hypothetical protein
MRPVTVACVLRRSADYDVDYVARLRDGVAAHLPAAHRFVCLSDVPVPCERFPLVHDWPGWWAKMELFRPDVGGDLLYFDLDTVITGDLAGLAGVGRLTMLSDFYWPERVASGVMYLPQADRAWVWRHWIADPAGHMERAGRFDDRRAIGDGKILGRLLGDRPTRFQDLLPGQIVSYKVDVRQATGRRFERGRGVLPAGARVVCFHGQPRPRDIGWQLPMCQRVPA